MSVTARGSEPKARRRAMATAAMAVLLVGAAPAQAGLAAGRREAVTITFSYRLDVPYTRALATSENSQISETRCTLRVPRRANGVAVLRAAVDSECIRSFSTVTNEERELLHCINQVCGDVTMSPGVIPDTVWFVAWNSETTSYGGQGSGGTRHPTGTGSTASSS